MTSQSSAQKPIGVFDSGVGGLTVYKALCAALPHECFVYLGDTARLPYGTKSSDTVAQYALQAAQWLMTQDIKLMVVACNTASAQGFAMLQKLLPELPCVDVIEPGAQAAVTASPTGRIAVLATEGTVRSQAYVNAIKRHRPEADVQALGCNLLVALAEETWLDGIEAETIIRRYLSQLRPAYDTLVLGCTHFPLLKPLIQKMVGTSIKVIDSAETTAATVKTTLDRLGLAGTAQAHAGNKFYVTDAPERFNRLAQCFLGHAAEAATVNIGVNIGQTSATIAALNDDDPHAHPFAHVG